MRLSSFATVVLVAGSFSFAATSADATGLASMHKTKRIGGKTCMIDHPHHRTSGAFRTERQAKARAIRAWMNYTRIEYGSAWSNYRIAIKKNFNCSTVSGGQTSCDLVANPCRR